MINLGRVKASFTGVFRYIGLFHTQFTFTRYFLLLITLLGIHVAINTSVYAAAPCGYQPNGAPYPVQDCSLELANPMVATHTGRLRLTIKRGNTVVQNPVDIYIDRGGNGGPINPYKPGLNPAHTTGYDEVYQLGTISELNSEINTEINVQPGDVIELASILYVWEGNVMTGIQDPTFYGAHQVKTTYPTTSGVPMTEPRERIRTSWRAKYNFTNGNGTTLIKDRRYCGSPVGIAPSNEDPEDVTSFYTQGNEVLSVICWEDSTDFDHNDMTIRIDYIPGTVVPTCGNGFVEQGETCDGTPGCRPPGSADECTFCGDTITQTNSGEQCDDGNLVDTDACTNSCQSGLCTYDIKDLKIDPDGVLKDRMTRISALNGNLTFTWEGVLEQTGYQCPGERKFDIYITEKQDLSVSTPASSNTPGCDFTGVAPVGTVPGNVGYNDGVEFEYERDNLDYNKAYCWKVVATNGPEVAETPIYTFRTNMFPKFLRMGMQFSDAPNDDNHQITSDVNQSYPNIGTPVCSSGVPVTTCSNPSNSNTFGGANCWSGKVQTLNITEKPANPVTFWFEYEDEDNYYNPWSGNTLVNENYRHMLAIVPEQTDLSYGTGTPILTTGRNSFHYSLFTDLQNETSPSSSYNATIPTTSNRTFTNIRQYIDPVTKKVRIYHTVEFKDDFPTGKYSIYAIFQSRTLDPTDFGAGSIFLSDDHKNCSAGECLTKGAFLDGLFGKRGNWSVDTNTPNATIDRNITGASTLDISWRAFESSPSIESGINDSLKAVCFTSNLPPYTLDFLGSGSFPYGNPINIQQSSEGPDINNCVPIEALPAVTGGGFTGSYRINYHNAQDLKIRLKSVKDNACNPLDNPPIITVSVLNPWVSTTGGTVYTDTSIDLAPPQSIYENGLNLKENMGQIIYKNVKKSLLNLSTNFLGSENNNGGSKSRIGMIVNNYFDPNEKPRAQTVSTWYDFFFEEIGRNGYAVEEHNNVNPVEITTFLTNNSPDFAIHKYTGDVVLRNGTCQNRGVIFIEGNLTVYDNFLNANDSSGCIFLVKGNINFYSPNNISTTGLDSSYYDVVQGFFFAVGPNSVVHTKDPNNTNLDLDGLNIYGSIIGKDVNFNRNLGLRNNLQPSEYLKYDSRYAYIFLELLRTKNLHLREKGYAAND